MQLRKSAGKLTLEPAAMISDQVRASLADRFGPNYPWGAAQNPGLFVAAYDEDGGWAIFGGSDFQP